MSVYNRRQLLSLAGAAATALAAPPALRNASASSDHRSVWIGRGPRIKVGLLWSLTGHLALIERPSHDVALYWIDEVNRAGGVAGFQIEPVVVDAKSDMRAFRHGILHLMTKENVLATFGGYISASRRAVMPLVTLHDGIFYYPTCYEGRECWQNIICTGPIANQHSFDLIPYMVKNYGNRAFFVGSNYIWAWESNRNARQWLARAGGEMLGERYIPLGYSHFEPLFEEIRQKAPDWIFSTVVADSDLHFRRAYAHGGFSPEKMPIASLTTSELEVKTLGASYAEGHILCAPYFQSLGGDTNRRFVDRFLGSPFGGSGVTHYNMEETYLSFLYFRKAVESIVSNYGASKLSPSAIRSESRSLGLTEDESPEGPVYLDPNNLNSWLTPRIGRFNSSGQVDLLWDRMSKVPPMPYFLYPERGICRPDGLHLPNGKIVKAAS